MSYKISNPFTKKGNQYRILIVPTLQELKDICDFPNVNKPKFISKYPNDIIIFCSDEKNKWHCCETDFNLESHNLTFNDFEL